MAKQRDFSLVTSTGARERVHPPGLVVGRHYRRKAGNYNFDPCMADTPIPDTARPVVEYVEGVYHDHPQAGLVGWFKADGKWYPYLATDVEEANAATGMTFEEQAGTECVACPEQKPRYSRGLCTRCYGRWRKLVKDQGMDENEAVDAVRASYAETSEEGE